MSGAALGSMTGMGTGVALAGVVSREPGFDPPEDRMPDTPIVVPTGPVIPMDVLMGSEEIHNKLRDYLVDRLQSSEKSMSKFYARWQVNERKYQAYVKLDNEEELKKSDNEKGQAPQIISIIMPYCYAVVQTRVTYLLHTFTGRKPMFQVSAYRGDHMANARSLEQVLQHNCDHAKLIMKLHQMFMAAEIYQFGVLRVDWQTVKQKRTKFQQTAPTSFTGMAMQAERVPVRQEQIVYSGNSVDNIDPFLFFPDPRVPMTEVNKRGEFVFWRSFEGRHMLKWRESQGTYQGIDKVTKFGRQVVNQGEADSDRALRAGGDSLTTGGDRQNDPKLQSPDQIDEGTVVIVPADWGFSDSRVPTKYLFTLVNKDRIVRAEEFDADHDLHPVAVIEPNAQGANFGAIATVDVCGPIQDLLSWLVNSHMMNVREVINNRILIDPSMFEMGDFKKGPGEGGWLVRMKPSKMGQDVRQSVYQLQVQDVTASHLRDLQGIIQMGHMFTAVNENLMGLHEEGGRKTATEVRTAGEAGASRLAALARIISAQGLSDLASMMGTNIQQKLDPAFQLTILGPDGSPVTADPSGLSGDFFYPINDGTLPMDRVALLDVWQNIFKALLEVPPLAQQYDMVKVFDYIADLAGAKEIKTFHVMPTGAPPPPGATPMPPPGAGGPGPMAPQMSLGGQGAPVSSMQPA